MCLYKIQHKSDMHESIVRYMKLKQNSTGTYSRNILPIFPNKSTISVFSPNSRATFECAMQAHATAYTCAC